MPSAQSAGLSHTRQRRRRRVLVSANSQKLGKSERAILKFRGDLCRISSASPNYEMARVAQYINGIGRRQNAIVDTE